MTMPAKINMVGRLSVPFSPNNPNRGPNIVALVISGTVIFVSIMAVFVVESLAGKDTTDLLRFLSIFLGSVVPSAFAAIYAAKSAHASNAAREDINNGVLKDKVKEGVAEVLSGDTTKVVYSGGTSGEASTQEGGNTSGGLVQNPADSKL